MSNKPKFVYFIRPAGMDGPFKIGCSDTPDSRLLTFAPWSPYPLELIGAVPGGTSDENFLHRAFANVHFHHEWFHSNPQLRATIKTVIEGNSVDAARAFLKAQRPIRKSLRIVRAPEHQRFLDLQAQVWATQKGLRNLDENGAWGVPEDVLRIVRRWNAQVYRDTAGFKPSEDEMRRVNEYLTNPVEHSIIPAWKLVRRANTQATA